MAIDELKPCPFCGGNAEIKIIDPVFGSPYKQALIDCTVCNVEMTWAVVDRREDLAARNVVLTWNTREDDPE